MIDNPHGKRILPDGFISFLRNSPKRKNVFNPWGETDPDHDNSKQAPAIRRRQLLHYLSERMGKAKFLLVGEAIGYQGGHFTGIPMTSERILMGGHKKRGIYPEHVFSTIKPQRTSKPILKPLGFSEPTGTIVWQEIIESKLSAYNFILWNAFPWHPYNPDAGRLSNRTPTKNEFQAGLPFLSKLIKMTGTKKVVAVGEKSYQALTQLGIESIKVRHPANAGAKKFRKQMAKILV
ncbi:uracil-DNA glycosylase [Thermodesulfobacteriota bacterium]